MFKFKKKESKPKMEASEKKTISIFGSCCSRNIFNYPHMTEVFEVKNYVFQVAMWECFGQMLDIPLTILKSISPNRFQATLLDYGFNKTVVSELEKNRAEYILIDTQSFVSPIYKVEYCGMATYIQHFRATELLPKLQEKLGREQFRYQVFDIKNFPKGYIEERLRKFAEWLKTVYAQSNIILYAPQFVDLRVGKNFNFEKLPPHLVKINSERNYIINLYYELLKSFLPKAKILHFDAKRTIADDYAHSKNIYSAHYSNNSYIEQGMDLLKVLNIDYRDYYSYSMDPKEYMMEYYLKCYADCRKKISELESMITGEVVEDKFLKLPVSTIVSLNYDFGFKNIDELKKVMEQKKYS